MRASMNKRPEHKILSEKARSRTNIHFPSELPENQGPDSLPEERTTTIQKISLLPSDRK